MELIQVDEMAQSNEYIVSCWQCMAEYNAQDSPFCNHPSPSKTCPFCLNCFPFHNALKKRQIKAKEYSADKATSQKGIGVEDAAPTAFKRAKA